MKPNRNENELYNENAIISRDSDDKLNTDLRGSKCLCDMLTLYYCLQLTD